MLLFYYISDSVSMNVVFFQYLTNHWKWLSVRVILFLFCAVMFILSVLSRVLIFNLKLLFSLHQEQPLIRVKLNQNLFYRDLSASSIRGGSSYTRRKWEEDVKKNSLNEGPTSLNTSYQRRCGIFSYLFF